MRKGLFLQTFITVRWLKKWRNRQALESYQADQWRQKKAYFLERSPYFREHGLTEDFTMDKAFMMAHFDQLNTVGVSRKEAMELALASERSRDFTGQLAGISVGLSSGTSGNQGIFLTTEREQTIWAATILAKLLPKGQLFGNRLAFFLRSDNALYQSVNSPILQLTYFDMQRRMSEHIDRLNDLQPNLLVAPASVLLQLAKARSEGSLQISPEKVISVAEILEDGDRETIARAFDQEVIHQVYQATEGFLACSCEYGNLHLNEDALIIDKEWLDDKRFYPIITDFKRESQPFVGYRLNDIVQIGESPCPCGSCLQVIERIEGRSDDIFYAQGLDGDYRALFPDFIRRCFLQVEGLLNYQVEQVSLGTLVIGLEDQAFQDQVAVAFSLLAKTQEIEPYHLEFQDYQPPSGEKLRRIKQGMPAERKEAYAEKAHY